MNKQYITDDLRILQSEKCDICISIITPTHRLSPERRTDALQLGKAIEEPKMQLLTKYNKDTVKPLQPPIQPHQVLTDAVTQLIRMVHEKNGEVIILENDALQDYQRLALITRY